MALADSLLRRTRSSRIERNSPTSPWDAIERGNTPLPYPAERNGIATTIGVAPCRETRSISASTFAVHPVSRSGLRALSRTCAMDGWFWNRMFPYTGSSSTLE